MKKEFEKRFDDPRTIKVLGFLIAKGFLWGKNFSLKPNVKIHIEELLWVGNYVEPRVIEVFPAAIIHFPKTFIGYNKIPPELNEVILKIKRGMAEGPDYQGIKYKDMKRWSEKTFLDKRTKPLSEIRINKTFRLKPHIVAKLKKLAEIKKTTVTECLESLIDKS